MGVRSGLRRLVWVRLLMSVLIVVIRRRVSFLFVFVVRRVSLSRFCLRLSGLSVRLCVDVVLDLFPWPIFRLIFLTYFLTYF